MKAKTNKIEDARYNLWKFFSDEHGLTLLEGELTDIVREVEKYQKTTKF